MKNHGDKPVHGGSRTVFDRAAATYGQVGTDFFSELGELLVERAAIPVGSRVLDVGAGTGAVTQAAAGRVSSNGSVLATDLSWEMLLQLRRNLRDRTSGRVASALMDAVALGVRTGSFDAAMSGLVLQSIPDPAAAVAEMCRVVRSSGILGITTSPGWWWETDPRWQWHADLLDRLGIVSDLLPSSGQQPVAELLVTAPVSNIESNDVVLQIEWDSSETYWQWCWSHGWRAVMERLTEKQLLEYRRGVEEAIGYVSPIEGQVLANLTTASRR